VKTLLDHTDSKLWMIQRAGGTKSRHIFLLRKLYFLGSGMSKASFL
jgi:hypothetical protein